MILIPSVLTSIRLNFGSLICVEYDRGVVDSLKASWQITEGKVIKLLGFYILLGLLNIILFPIFIILILLTCLLGIFPIALFYSSATGAIYNELTKHVNVAEAFEEKL